MPEQQIDYIDVAAFFALAGMLAHSRGEFEGHAGKNAVGEDEAHLYGRMYGYRSRKPEMDWHQAIVEEAYELADCMLAAKAAREAAEE